MPEKDFALGSMSAELIQSLIVNAVKAQLDKLVHEALYEQDWLALYALWLSPPEFNQFDGKGNHKQHIAHFIETCNNAGMEGDWLVTQFVRSLKGIALD